MNPHHSPYSFRWIHLGGLASFALALTSIACTAETDVRTETQLLGADSSPPGGLLPGQVPQFVSVSFDDNFNSEGMNWATTHFQNLRNPAGAGNPLTFDGTLARTSFFHNSTYIGHNTGAWGAAVTQGHETADHTVGHGNGLNFTGAQWAPQVNDCRSQLSSGLGVPAADIVGFRAPFLAYNDALYSTLGAASPDFIYDSSIQSCWASSENGTNCAWPYTLDDGSLDAESVHAKFGSSKAAMVGAHPGVWEVPVSTLVVPPDSMAAQYGIATGLRGRVQTALGGNSAPSFYEQSTGKVAGLDITLLVDGRMTRAEALATLKYSLDLRLSGNRAPLVFVAHTHVYANGYSAAVNVPNTADRRALIEEFLAYALSRPEVRVRPIADIVEYMQNPAPLGQCAPSCTNKECGSNGCGGTCGTCAAGEACSGAGQCESSCVPACDGKSCGADGCGGVCGTCAAGQTCSSGACTSGGCTAPAWNAQSAYLKGARVSYQSQQFEARWYTQNQRPDLFDGPDGAGLPWTVGIPCQGTCTPSCSGLECGSDGCGGSCGTCGSGETCSSGNCQSTCTPSCSGRECGSNGCGGTCGTCGAGETCSAGSCESTCTPSCSGLECGSNGCGGTCGTCGAGETCRAGLCEGGTSGCSGLPSWKNGASYTAGAEVQSAGGRYTCKGWPYTGWCGAGTAYEPGVGFAWRDAWTSVGACQ